MYLHLGGETLVKTEEIIGLFDLDTASLSKKTRDFLAGAEKAGRVVNVSTELPKSFVLAGKKGRPKGGGHQLFISQLGTATLKKRLEQQRKKQVLNELF